MWTVYPPPLRPLVAGSITSGRSPAAAAHFIPMSKMALE